MPDLREQLENCFQGRVCLVGVGNVDRGDDGFGVRLAEALAAKLEARNSKLETDIVLAGTTPERRLGRIADSDFIHVIFLDVVEFGGAPGSVVFLDATGIASRFPQISTHKISLGTLAKVIEANGLTKAWLLGVQPASVKEGSQLTPAVQRTLTMLAELLNGVAERGTGLSCEPAGRNVCATPFRDGAVARDVSAPAQSVGNRQPAIA